jgi:hypothetical protein
MVPLRVRLPFQDVAKKAEEERKDADHRNQSQIHRRGTTPAVHSVPAIFAGLPRSPIALDEFIKAQTVRRV